MYMHIYMDKSLALCFTWQAATSSHVLWRITIVILVSATGGLSVLLVAAALG